MKKGKNMTTKQKLAASKLQETAGNISKAMKLAGQKAKFLEYYRNLPIQKLAASSIGKDEDTIIHWKHADADFADQTEVARAEWALAKSGQVKSVEWLLERVMKDHFSQKIETEHGLSEEVQRIMEHMKKVLPRAK